MLFEEKANSIKGCIVFRMTRREWFLYPNAPSPASRSVACWDKDLVFIRASLCPQVSCSAGYYSPTQQPLEAHLAEKEEHQGTTAQ